jgi:hypothetical protein
MLLKIVKKMPNSWKDQKKASREWLPGFLKRHSKLSLRRPEATRLSRSTKKNAEEFFKKLKAYQEKKKTKSQV